MATVGLRAATLGRAPQSTRVLRSGEALWESYCRDELASDSPVIVRSIARFETTAARAIVASILPSVSARGLALRGAMSDGRARAVLARVRDEHDRSTVRRTLVGLDALGRHFATRLGWPADAQRIRSSIGDGRSDLPWLDEALDPSAAHGIQAHEFMRHAAGWRSSTLADQRTASWIEACQRALWIALADAKVTLEDCGTGAFERLPVARCEGLVLAEKLDAGAIDAAEGSVVTAAMVAAIEARGGSLVSVRTALGCRAPEGVCAKCVGAQSDVGASVGRRAIGALIAQVRALGPRAEQRMIC